MNPAIFLDRDGVINHNRPDYVRCWSEFVFLDGSLVALQRLAQTDYKIVVVSNQSAVNRGLVTRVQVDEINQCMQLAVERVGARIDAIYYCPHQPSDRCSCRKPQPGLLLQAAHDLDLDLGASYLIGDALSDVQAALSAGCHPILVLTGRGADQIKQVPPHLRSVSEILPDLPSAVDWILVDHDHHQS